MPEHLQVLERALVVSPDFVLLQLYINDFETPDIESSAVMRDGIAADYVI